MKSGEDIIKRSAVALPSSIEGQLASLLDLKTRQCDLMHWICHIGWLDHDHCGSYRLGKTCVEELNSNDKLMI
jgi:hypothetical protein